MLEQFEALMLRWCFNIYTDIRYTFQKKNKQVNVLFIRAIPPHGRNYRMCLTMTGRLKLFNRWCFLFKMQKSTCNPPIYFLTLYVWALVAKSSFPSIRAVHVCFCPTVIQAVSQRSVGTSVQLYPDVAGSQLIGRMDATITGSAKDGIVRLAVDLQGENGRVGKLVPNPGGNKKISSERAIVTPLWGWATPRT